MTSTVNTLTFTLLDSPSYIALSLSLGALTLLVLFMLLVQKEIARAGGGPQSADWMRVLDVAIAPLLFAIGVLIVVRIIDLIS